MRNTDEMEAYAYSHGYPLAESISVNKNEKVNLINLNHLHDALKVSTPFRIWFGKIRREFGYEEVTDYYLSNTKKSKKTREVLAKIPMAADFCMMQKTEIGDALAEFYTEYRQALETKRIQELEERLDRLEKELGIVTSDEEA